MSQLNHPLNALHAIDRYRFLMILNTANICEEYQFTKQASMLWLVNFPGDLFVKYHQAMSYANLEQKKEAISVLEKLVELDPTFLEPNRALSQLSERIETKDQFAAITQYLEGKRPPDSDSEPWLATLWEARSAYTQGELEQTISRLHQTLVNNPPTPIPAILHLQAVYKMNNQEMLNNLSEIYHQQWPKCLQINVIRALVEIELGMEATAVERLHWVAAHDSAGQVIQQLMGAGHRFQDLWPDRFEIHFDLPIPASITAYLGWNKLKTGQVAAPTFTHTSVEKPAVKVSGSDATQKISVAQPLPPQPKTIEESPTVVVEEVHESENEEDKWASQEDFDEIQQVFSKIAKRIKKPELERADNRFPVYVVMSAKKQLEKVYGPNTAAIIDENMTKLVGLIQNLPDWGATQFYPDDPQQLSPMGIKPVFGTDPYQIKLALADLDQALAKNGEMIGALLIVGGPEIVPFHHLPNPTFDNDLDVPSDNPYACIDENYFISQWPVGRLPGETGSDAGLLLEQIRGLIEQYQQRSKYSKSGLINVASLIHWLTQFFSNLGSSLTHTTNFGYSAEIWQRASAQVYKSVGKTKDLHLSPPINVNSLTINNNQSLRAGYFNLHGVKDGPHWYGQKDFSSESNGPDYPIALSPTMFDEKHPAPKLVLSEACYGAHVYEKRYDEALSLKCLDAGTSTFIGSTCIAYGSITPPLIAADYLAEKFWQKVLEGSPAGYALMGAKLSLAEEMTKIQGFLDGEDQKTLLSFVLYGDPLALHDGLGTMPKPLFRFKSYPSIKAISDSDMSLTSDTSEMPKQVNKQVKKVVEKYLPGLQNAQMQIKKSAGSTASSKDPEGESTQAEVPERYVVTLRKSYDQNPDMVHHHFARMTFDKKGKLVKFSTSR
jgi:tetratricopeptide (TPR) repeat protein